MLFNSYVFIFGFLPVVLAGWWLIPSTRARLACLTLASYFFYSWWNWRFLPLMIASTTVDYIAGQRIVDSQTPIAKRSWLIGSLAFNLAVLGFFKYYGLFAESANAMAMALRLPALLPVLKIVLPIGISFYTFNSMSYTIDVYRGLVKSAKSGLHYAAFVALFPHLIAGPIVRYSDIEAQFNALKARLSSSEASQGIYFFVTGLAKKVLIADRLAPFANSFFAAPAHAGLIDSWLGALTYTFQLYFDFSGYSDMAVGLAHLLGFQFPQNFNSPYKAENIADFWRRWHMSLSTWLRDYLFIPLGGSRGSRVRTAVNLTLTMFLGGLWHGANWTFVVWGLYHGVLLVVHALARQRNWVLNSPVFNRCVTFLGVTVGWVLFRAESFRGATSIYRAMLGFSGLGHIPITPVGLLWLGASAGIAFLAKNSWEVHLEPKPVYAVALAGVFVAATLFLGNASPFLYFQF